MSAAFRAQQIAAMRRLDDFGSLTAEQADVALKLVSPDEQMFQYLRAKLVRDFAAKYDTCSVCKTKPKSADKTADYVNEAGRWTLRPMCTECRLEGLRKVGFKV